MKFLTLLILFFCFNATTAFAQELNFININTDMGLPSNECYRIAQDTRGYIWIATEAGLVKYNSKEFVLFDASKGMPSKDVYALDVDNKGRVWFATGNWDVGYILNDSVHTLPNINFYNNATWGGGDVIYKIKYCESCSSLFVSSHHQSIEIVEKNNIFISKQIDTITAPRDFVLLDCKGEKYIANQFNIKRPAGYQKNYAFNNYPIYVNTLKRDSMILPIGIFNTFFSELFSTTVATDKFWIGILNYVMLFNKQKQLLGKKVLPSQIQCMYRTDNNDIWVGCRSSGLYIFTNGDILKAPKHFLNGTSVSNIIEDKENGIWATTTDKGIYYCPNKKIYIIPNSYNTKKVAVFSKVEDNKLWIKNGESSLMVISEDTAFIKQLGEEKNPSITDVITAENGYFISTLYGVYLIDKTLKNVKELHLQANTKMGARGLIPNNKKIGVAYNSNTLFWLENDYSLKFMFITSPYIYSAIQYNNEDILFSAKNGLHIIHEKRLTQISTQAAKKTHNVNNLYIDSYKNVWLPANTDSLLVLDRNFNLKTVVSIKTKEINYNKALQISALKYFICTNKGLLQISFVDSSFSKYSISFFDRTHGLPSNDVFNVLQFKDKFYISTSKGICIFNNTESLQHLNVPNTIINTFTVNDSSIHLTNNQSFSYTQNNFSFKVDALVFKKTTQRGSFFKYRLDGFESEFKTATGNTITYNNLPPGKYNFIAKAFYDDATEDTTPAEFSFTIRPALWQTWWGILLIVIGIAGIVFLFVQWRIKKIKLVEKEKAAINQTIATYKFTALKAQMDPHFVFNSINVIQNLILEKDKTEAYGSLSKFSQLIRKILNQSDSVFATIEEELALIKLYVELNQLRVEYPFTFNADIEPGLLAVSIPSLIIQPFVENALWHGILPLKGKKEGMILLKIFTEPNNILVIEVTDNGIGRKVAGLTKSSLPHVSKGVDLIKERLKAYQAMNNNCLAQIDIFDLEENNISTGTLVQIKLAILDEA